MDDLMRAMLDLNALDKRIVSGKARMMELAREVSAQEKTIQEARDKARQVEAAGVKTIIYTDTATDGMLGGPNLNAMAQMCGAVSCDIIASGGVSAPEHVSALKALGCPNLYGAIVGKALYDGKTTLAAMMAAAR